MKTFHPKLKTSLTSTFLFYSENSTSTNCRRVQPRCCHWTFNNATSSSFAICIKIRFQCAPEKNKHDDTHTRDHISWISFYYASSIKIFGWWNRVRASDSCFGWTEKNSTFEIPFWSPKDSLSRRCAANEWNPDIDISPFDIRSAHYPNSIHFRCWGWQKPIIQSEWLALA